MSQTITSASPIKKRRSAGPRRRLAGISCSPRGQISGPARKPLSGKCVGHIGGDTGPSRSELCHCAVPRASCSVAHRKREVNEGLAFTNQKNPGNRGKGNGVNSSNGSSQSARKNTASVSAEPIANSTTSSLSRARDMTCNANAAALAQLTRGAECRSAVAN